uniref:ZZ-type domain-containing protein n=1 Tax=Trichuris muris TaxID=70415 RepID=A0A5S6QYC7_TRIMR
MDVLVVKVYLPTGIRRFTLARDRLTFKEFTERLKTVVTDFSEATHQVTYDDEDGERITFSTDMELLEAIRVAETSSKVLRIYILDKSKQKGPTVTDDLENPTYKSAVHPHVLCDVCDREIVGIRYKCLVCDDYDVCEQCEPTCVHDPGHIMLRICRPKSNLSLTVAMIRQVFSGIPKCAAEQLDHLTMRVCCDLKLDDARSKAPEKKLPNEFPVVIETSEEVSVPANEPVVTEKQKVNENPDDVNVGSSVNCTSPCNEWTLVEDIANNGNNASKEKGETGLMVEESVVTDQPKVSETDEQGKVYRTKRGFYYESTGSHSDPLINGSLQVMVAMGFVNCKSLVDILEKFNGNVNAALNELFLET